MTRLLTGLLLALVSAALLIVIWPSYGNLWWLTFVAFVPMYVAQYRVLPRRWSGLAVGIAFGAYYFALFLHATSVLSMGPIIGIGIAANRRPTLRWTRADDLAHVSSIPSARRPSS